MNLEYIKKLDELVSEGYLRRVVSPCGKLVLFNYNDKCTYEKHWNEYTLNARGTVYELATGKVVARAFPKFFNLGELPEEKQKELIGRTDFTVAEKVDGSLGIVYYYDGEWRVNTRGSFTSDQAVKAKEMLEKYDMKELREDLTLLCEIIYPENKIIINYGQDEKLVLLGVVSTDGVEYNRTGTCRVGIILDMEYANRYDYSFPEMLALQKTLPKDNEGFVVRFSDGYRVKIKGEEYMKIARVKANLSPLTLWSEMKNGKVNEEFLSTLPEELEEEVNEIVDKLEFRYKLTELQIEYEYNYLMLYVPNDSQNVCKDLGLLLKKYPLQHRSAIFSAHKNQLDNIDKYIMKRIKPKGNKLED